LAASNALLAAAISSSLPTLPPPPPVRLAATPKLAVTRPRVGCGIAAFSMVLRMRSATVSALCRSVRRSSTSSSSPLTRKIVSVASRTTPPMRLAIRLRQRSPAMLPSPSL